MKIYYVCECCRQIFNDTEVEGPEGAVELKGTCPECSRELGLEEPPVSIQNQHFYN